MMSNTVRFILAAAMIGVVAIYAFIGASVVQHLVKQIHLMLWSAAA